MVANIVFQFVNFTRYFLLCTRFSLLLFVDIFLAIPEKIIFKIIFWKVTESWFFQMGLHVRSRKDTDKHYISKLLLKTYASKNDGYSWPFIMMVSVFLPKFLRMQQSFSWKIVTLLLFLKISLKKEVYSHQNW